MSGIDLYRKRTAPIGEYDESNSFYKDQLLRGLEGMLATSPNSTDIVIDSTTYRAILETKKYSANKDLKNIVAPYTVPVVVGDTFTAIGEEWLVIEQNLKVVDAYFSGVAVKTNYLLKWIDQYGNIHQEYAFITGSMYSFVSDAFNTSPVHIATTVNETVAVMPSGNLEVDDRILFNDKAWTVISIDEESISGLAFISLKDTPVNQELDNLELQIADYYQERNWTIEIQQGSVLELLVAEAQTIVPVVKLNGIVQDETCEILTTPTYVSVSDLEVTGLSLGNETINIGLVNNNSITQSIDVHVVAAYSVSRTVYIKGTDKVEPLTTYTLQGFETVNGQVALADGTFSIVSDVSSIIESLTAIDTNSASLEIAEHANVGDTATIKFSSDGDENTLVITIKSFWT